MIALILAAAVETGPFDIQTLMAKVGEQASIDAQHRYKQHLTGTKRQTNQKGKDKPRESQWQLEMMPDSIMERQVIDEDTAVANAPLNRPKLDLVASMGTKYLARLINPKPVDSCYWIEFEPADPDQDAATNEEMIANHLTGTVCIDKDHFFARKIEAHLLKPFSKSVVGRALSAKVTINYEWADGAARPKDSDCTIKFSKGFGLFLNSTEHVTVTYEYDPVATPTAAPAPSSP